MCSCGGSHHGDRLVEAGEPEFFSIVERPQGGWTVVSVSPFDGSSDTLVVDKPMTNIIVMSTSHYGFLDALGRTDVISGISGPDYLWTENDLFASEDGSSRQADSERAGAASLDGETHATLGTVRGGTGAERSEARSPDWQSLPPGAMAEKYIGVS